MDTGLDKGNSICVPTLGHKKNMHMQALFASAMIRIVIQSGLNISESVILTNSNNDTDLVGTNFFSVILIRYSGKFVFRLRHNKTGNQRCYFLHNQYPLYWHLVKHASLLRKLHRLIALLYFISALDRKVWLSVGRYEKVRQRYRVSVYTS